MIKGGCCREGYHETHLSKAACRKGLVDLTPCGGGEGANGSWAGRVRPLMLLTISFFLVLCLHDL